MALVVICGQPCSGKSTAATCLAGALRSLESTLNVRVIDETFFHLDRNQGYANMTAEKNIRGVLRSEVDRSVSKDNIIIVDSLNNIKGYRYELWCLARAAGVRYCVLYSDVEETDCQKWNEDRKEKGEATYNENDPLLVACAIFIQEQFLQITSRVVEPPKVFTTTRIKVEVRKSWFQGTAYVGKREAQVGAATAVKV